jgi:hypothetical protein
VRTRQRPNSSKGRRKRMATKAARALGAGPGARLKEAPTRHGAAWQRGDTRPSLQAAGRLDMTQTRIKLAPYLTGPFGA